MNGLLVRVAVAGDAESCLRIYAPIVRDTAISFELEPPSVEEMRERIRAAHVWLVAEIDGAVAGYAYATPHRPRPAYRQTVETSVYVAPDEQRRGVGRALYAALLARLRELGFRTAVAVIGLPNDASERLHEALGFRRVGVFHNVGFKHGRWHDTVWWERDLGTL